jgi:hypothetical protein
MKSKKTEILGRIEYTAGSAQQNGRYVQAERALDTQAQ